MVNKYWVVRRGMAYGILCGASGLSGTVMPFVIQALLARYGYRTTLRAVAVALALLTGPLIPLLKGRLPFSPGQVATHRWNWTFFRSPLFWVYSVSNILQGFGYFFPSLYLPSYASSLGLSNKSGALLLALMSIFQVGGQFVFGLLSDRKVPLDILASLSTERVLTHRQQNNIRTTFLYTLSSAILCQHGDNQKTCSKGSPSHKMHCCR
jgi:cyanate permease